MQHVQLGLLSFWTDSMLQMSKPISGGLLYQIICRLMHIENKKAWQSSEKYVEDVIIMMVTIVMIMITKLMIKIMV